MALIRYPKMDGGGSEDGGGYQAYVDPASGQVYKQVVTGGDFGAQTTYEPLNKTWEYANNAGVDGRNIYGSAGYTPQQFMDNGEGGMNSGAPGGFTARGDYQLGNWQPDATLVNFLQQRGITPQYDAQAGWIIPASQNPASVMTDYANKINPRNAMSFGQEFMDSVISPAMKFYGLASGLGSLAAMGAGTGAGAFSTVNGVGAGEFVTPQMLSEAVANGTLTAQQAASILQDIGGLASGAAATGSLNLPSSTMEFGGSPVTSAFDAGGGSPIDPNYRNPFDFGGGDPIGIENVPTGMEQWYSQAPTIANTGGLPFSSGGTVNLANSGMMTGATGAAVGAAGGASNATSALQRILNGTATTQDYLSMAGSLGGSALGALGSDAQRNALNTTADKYLQMGAPYRGLLGQSYQPGFTMMNEPGYKDALDASTNSFLRAASAGQAPGVSGGNPMDNPGAWAETQKYVTANTALPALNTYRSQLGSFGQLGTNTAGTANLQAAAGAGGGYNAAGYGLGQMTNPSSSLDDLLKQFGQLGLPSNQTYKPSGVVTF